MRSILLLCLAIAVATMLAIPHVLAQSGVMSGPPQVYPGPSSPDQPMRERVTWIAVAAGFDGSGKNVGVGYSGPQPSRTDAEDEATTACNRRGRDMRCQNPLAVSAGCLYVAPGSKRGGVTWGRGATRDMALEECRRGGYTCPSNKVIGGCVPGYAN